MVSDDKNIFGLSKTASPTRSPVRHPASPEFQPGLFKLDPPQEPNIFGVWAPASPEHSTHNPNSSLDSNSSRNAIQGSTTSWMLPRSVAQSPGTVPGPSPSQAQSLQEHKPRRYGLFQLQEPVATASTSAGAVLGGDGGTAHDAAGGANVRVSGARGVGGASGIVDSGDMSAKGNNLGGSSVAEVDPGGVSADVLDGVILDLVAFDYVGGGAWPDRVPGRPAATVPAGVRYDSVEQAFVFLQGGDVISAPLATSPQTLPEVTYSAWVKILEPIAPGNLGWFVGQSPDYGWSRALTLNDFRLGYVSITTSTYWDSALGRAPVGSWLHIVGVWRQGGQGDAYMNGIRGACGRAQNGRGSDPNETLVIGGRCAGDAAHNAAVAIAHVRVFNRALSEAEVVSLWRRGREMRRAEGSPKISTLADDTLDTTDKTVVKGKHVKQGYLLEAAQLPPRWDDEARLFWMETGVNAYDLPDGNEWNAEFQEALERSKPTAMNRTLQVPSGVAMTPLSPLQPLRGHSRKLAQHPSDPEKFLRRAAHSTALRQMSRKSGIALKVQDHKIALFRFDNRVFAVDAECPHQGGSLVDGEIGDIEDMVEGRRCYVMCPVHKFQFDLSTGAVMQGTCPKLPTYAVRVRAPEGIGKGRVAAVEIGFESLASNFFDEFEADDF
eukprot:TRINITY_DN42733_c0_g1_i1.p1 TRINITY_DN42733_c0_g1~~TRINITY_DN42733_c0_g1_i1.p1  ORF type:complete len:719 (-),score=104.66 TRINITY_DN42733_c0_g1_i1:161-2152(-)